MHNPNIMSRSLLLFPVLFVLLLSCNVSPDEVADTVPPAPEVSLSDDELVVLAQTIEDDFNLGDGSIFEEFFDLVIFFERMVWPHVPKKNEVAEFVREMQPSPGEKGFGMRIVGKMQEAGQISFLRVARDTEGVRLLYRYEGVNDALSYLELLIAEDKENKRPTIVDFYNASTGEHFSRTMRRLLYSNGTGLLARVLDKVNNEAEKAVEAAETMQQMVDEGKYDEALDHFDALPENVQQQKTLQFIRVKIAMESGDNERYAAAIKEMLDLYPNDAGLNLIQIDHFIIRKEYDSALAAYDRLDKRVRDPYLDSQRAYVYLAKGDLERAAQSANAVIRWDSTLVEPHYVLVAVANKKKDYVAVAQALERMQQASAETVEIDFEVIESDAEYADFVRSKEYAVLKRKYQ